MLDGAGAIAAGSTLDMTGLAQAMTDTAGEAAKAGITAAEAAAAMATLSEVSDLSAAEAAASFKDLLNTMDNTGTRAAAHAASLIEAAAKAAEAGSAASTAGTARASQAATALLNNTEVYRRFLKEYENGTGYLKETAEKTAASWEGSAGRLTNSWTRFTDSLADSSVITGTMNTLSGLLGGITKVSERIGGLSSIGAITGLALGARNHGITRKCV